MLTKIFSGKRIYLALLLLVGSLLLINKFVSGEINQKNLFSRNQITILALGEDTTAPPERNTSWPEELEEILSERAENAKVRVVNEGISNANTSLILSQLEENLNKYRPDIVIAMMGINDGYIYDKFGESSTPTSVSIRQKLSNVITPIYAASADTYERLIQEGLRLSSQAKFDEAERKYKEAISNNPEDDRAYIELGNLYRIERRYPESEETFQQALKINPNNNVTYIKLGSLYRQMGELDKAETMYLRATELKPDDYWPYIDLGDLYRRRVENHPKAERAYLKAIELNPEGADWAYVGLGHLYRMQEKYEKSIEAFTKAMELNPENETSYVGLAHVYRILGRNEEAERLESKYLALNPTTTNNYRKLQNILKERDIKLVAVQYPLRKVELLKEMLEHDEDVFFVDNQNIFKEALQNGSYEEYFTDKFFGDFGHLSQEGHRLLAQNIADVLIEEALIKVRHVD